MKTLRLLRNVSAFFIFVTPLAMSRPTGGMAITSYKPRCVKTYHNTNCSVVNGVCKVTICYFGCTHTACATK